MQRVVINEREEEMFFDFENENCYKDHGSINNNVKQTGL